MSLPRYPEYRDSGVDWLGKVPAHWQVQPLKSRYAVVGGSTPKSDVPEYWDGDINWVTPADLSRLSGFEIHGSLRTITDLGLQSCGTSLVPGGSLILSTRAPIGSLGLATVEVCTNQGCKALVPRSGELSRFAAYAMSIAGPALNVRGKGTTFLELSGDELASFRLAFPGREEQRAIVTFLDHETAKIDALIAEQEKLLALLAEKRQATISHAVTRGLDPNAPLKDSGVPWLGQVPVHWGVVTLRRVAKAVETGGTPSSEPPSNEFEDGISWFTPGDFGAGLDLQTAAKMVSLHQVNAGDAKCFASGCVFIVGIGATLGKVGLIGAPASANQQINAISVCDSNDARFFAYSLSAKTEVMRFFSNASTIGIMNQSKTKGIPVVVPPHREQVAIAAFLDSEMAKLDSLEGEVGVSAELLRERRSALIAAAVTGQIDVRAWAS